MNIEALPWKLQVPLTRLLSRNSWSLSQAGQDFWVFGEVFNERRGGYFLDVGAHDGLTISNTYLLERRYGWTGLCVEANPTTFQKLVRNRRCHCLNVCLDRDEGEVEFALRDVLGGIVDPALDNRASAGMGAPIIRVKTVPLQKLLKEHAAPQIIDYLSIDIEGAEERVLGAFDFTSYRFNCLTIERPSPALRGLLDRHGYTLIKEIHELDCFYVHRDFLGEYKRNLFAFGEKRHLAFRWR